VGGKSGYGAGPDQYLALFGKQSCLIWVPCLFDADVLLLRQAGQARGVC
jgi:hypothetical protein